MPLLQPRQQLDQAGQQRHETRVIAAYLGVEDKEVEEVIEQIEEIEGGQGGTKQ